MQEISAKIINYKIYSSNIFISRNLKKEFELGIECKAKLKAPKDEDDKTVLLNIEFNIGTKDEELKIELVSDIIFELSQVPEVYNEGVEKELAMMASEEILNSLDDMLVTMGYKKMKLAKRIKR